MNHAHRLPAGASCRSGRGQAFLWQGLLVLSLACAAWPARAGDDCHVPVQQWQSREAVRRMADARGWQVQRLKIDDGCYEIRGTDAQGRAFKARIDPQTLAIVKIKLRDRDGKRARGSAPSPFPPGFTPAAPPRDPAAR